MKKLLILTIIFCQLIVVQGWSQDYKDAEGRAKCHTGWMKKELRLEDAQVKRVAEINTEFSKKMEDLKFTAEDYSLMTKRAKDLDLAKDQRLERVLSPEQLFRYQRLKTRVPELANTCLVSR